MMISLSFKKRLGKMRFLAAPAPHVQPDQAEGEGKTALAHALKNIQNESVRYRHLRIKPWLDEDGNVIWSWQRIWLARIVMNQVFETLMGLMIFCNVLLIVYEANADASCYPEFTGRFNDCPHSSSADLWPWMCNLGLQLIYSSECLARLFVERGMYFHNRWNMTDLMIVLVGWFGMALQEMVNLNVLRIFRVLRLLRAGRLLISVPELYILVSGLTTSIKAIFFGSIMLASVVFVWAIVMVELVHPLNLEIDYTQTLCPRCPRSFSTVYSASLTLFSQIVAGDGWGTLSLPLAEAHPWLSVILFAIIISISLGVMNLILAVIVEKAAEARQNDLDRKLAQKDLDREKNMIELALLCDRMDTDKSGALSLEEMLHGYVNEGKFYTLMQESGIEKDDIQTMFNVLDANNSGEVDYLEFCNLLGRCPKRDPMMLAAMTRYSVMELRKILQQDILEVVREQTELLKEQLDLLCHIPQCEAAGRALQKRRDERSASQRKVQRATAGGVSGFSQLQVQLEELSRWATQVMLAEVPKSPVGLPRGFLERPDSRSSVGSSQVTAKTSSSLCRNFSVAGQWNEIDRQFQQLNGKFDEQLRREKEMEKRCKRLMEDLSSTLEGKSGVIKEDL